jgi:hypothetical protein
MNDDFLPPRWQEYGRMITAFGGGVFTIVAGLVGYDTGRRTMMPGMPEPTRWIGGPIWIQIAFGAALLLYGVYVYRKFRSATRPNQRG